MARSNVDARIHFGAAAVVLAVVGWIACAGLSSERLPGDDSPALAWPSRAILLIGLVGFCAVFAEGGSGDWAAVYLQTLTGADPGTAAVAFTAFAFAMTAGRLVGDRVVRRLGPVRTVRVGGAGAAVGAALVVTATVPALAMVGFAILGLGVSVVVPLVFAAAGRAGANPAQAIAGVATIAYGSGLAAPASIGGIAQVSSLRVSFAVVCILCVAMAGLAHVLRSPQSSA
jgi:fucose permease